MVMGEFFGILTGVMYALLLVPNLLLALAVPYAILRVRDARTGAPDSQLGLKAALYFFYSVAIMMILFGLTVIVVDLVQDLDLGGPRAAVRQRPAEEFPNTAQRMGAAIILAGVLFVGLHFVLLKTLTDDRGPSMTRRTFLGWRFAINGIIAMFALTGLLIILFQKGEQSEMRNTMIGMLLVWAPAWVIHFSLFRVAAKQNEAARAGPTWES